MSRKRRRSNQFRPGAFDSGFAFRSVKARLRAGPDLRRSLQLVSAVGAIPMVNSEEDIPMPSSSNETSARWRVEPGSANPAGPLFVREHSAADIVCETGTTSGYCGTACTWSYPRQCC